DPTTQQLTTDLHDLAIIGAEVRVRLLGMAAAGDEALRMLNDAEKLIGTSAVLWHERRRYALALEMDDLAHTAACHVAKLAPQTAWEHFTLGRTLLRDDKLHEAAKQFEQALALEPQNFWPNFYQGVCAYRLKHFAEAVSAFRACVVLAPTTPE